MWTFRFSDGIERSLDNGGTVQNSSQHDERIESVYLVLSEPSRHIMPKNGAGNWFCSIYFLPIPLLLDMLILS